MSDEDHKPEAQKPQTMTKDRIDASLLNSRRIMIGRAFDNDLAEEVIKQLWFLELEAPGKPILLVINSPGGSVDSGFAIWDQIKMITSPVTTLITGLAASMGSVVALAAAPNRRFATPMSRFMIHQPSIMGTIQGQATDLEIHAREILKTKEQLINIYMKATGKSREIIEKAIDRDTWMSAQEALEFGHIDKIITSFKELEQVS
ncbi:MAG: ATP-dependent Clp protease proteolytic subunit [Chlamydiales bacterium]|nr:ATP-dependent Clp protease proteolytic subunit [Chlamydiales bacterium]